MDISKRVYNAMMESVRELLRKVYVCVCEKRKVGTDGGRVIGRGGRMC